MTLPSAYAWSDMDRARMARDAELALIAGRARLAEIRDRIALGVLHCTPKTCTALRDGTPLVGAIVPMLDGRVFERARADLGQLAHVLVLSDWPDVFGDRLGQCVVVCVGLDAESLCDRAERSLSERAVRVGAVRLRVGAKA